MDDVNFMSEKVDDVRCKSLNANGDRCEEVAGHAGAHSIDTDTLLYGFGYLPTSLWWDKDTAFINRPVGVIDSIPNNPLPIEWDTYSATPDGCDNNETKKKEKKYGN